MRKKINFKSDVFFTGATSKKTYTTDDLPWQAKEGDIVFDTTIQSPVYFTQGLWKNATNGETVKSVILDVFVLAGEVNMLGNADKTSNMPAGKSTQNALFYSSHHETRNNAESTQVYSDWSETTNLGETGEYSTRFGPEIGFVSKAITEGLTSTKSAIVKYTVTSSEMSDGDAAKSDWDSQATGSREGDCWRGLKAAIADATSKLDALEYTYRLCGLVFWQGESGTDTNKLSTFISDFRTLMGSTYSVTNTSSFPVVITQVDGATDISTIAATDNYTTLVDAGDFGQTSGGNVGATISSGNPDVNSNGINDMYEIGEEFALKLLYAKNGLDDFWTPAAITTKLWLDADDQTQLEVDALDAMTQLNDKSGTGSHMSLTNATSGTDSNNNVLLYDKSQSVFRITGQNANFKTHDKQHWYIVMKPTGVDNVLDPLVVMNGKSTNGQTEQTILFSYDLEGDGTQFYGRWYSYSSSVTWHPQGAPQADQYTYTGGSTDLVNSWSIIHVEWDITNSKASYRLNGNDVVINQDWDGSLILDSGHLQLFQYGDKKMDGKLGEIIFTTNTTEQTRQRVEGYLAHKWGLTTQLPTNHPYKTAHP